MKSIVTVVLWSGLVACAVSHLAIASLPARSAIAQQMPNGTRNAQPKVSSIALSKPALAKSWERPTLRISLPTTATKFKFSADGETLLTNGANEQSAELWSLRTGKLIYAFPAKSGFALCDVALSADGQLAAALMYSRFAPTLPTKRQVELKVWQLKTRQSQSTIPIQSHAIQTNETPVCQVEFSPNSRLLATSISSLSSQPQVGVRIWNARQGKLQQITRSGLTYISRLAFSPDSSVLGFISGDSQLHLWNLSTRTLQAKLEAVDDNYVMSIVDIVFSPNQQKVIAFAYDGGLSSRIYQWQIKTGKLQSSWELPLHRTDSLLALSPDAQTYVYGGDVTGYHIGNFQTGKEWQFPQNLSPISGQTEVVFSPDAQQMATAPGDRTIKILR